MTDAEALALVRRGRCEGLEWLMERYTRYVGAVAARILAGRLEQEDVEEVVSDAFLALWRAAKTLRTESVRAWLGTTARNLALNRLRAAHFDAELSEDTLRLDADPAQALEETLLRQTVTAAAGRRCARRSRRRSSTAARSRSWSSAAARSRKTAARLKFSASAYFVRCPSRIRRRRS